MSDEEAYKEDPYPYIVEKFEQEAVQLEGEYLSYPDRKVIPRDVLSGKDALIRGR